MSSTLVALISSAGLVACGSSGYSQGAGKIIARVGHIPITTEELSHWMQTLAGGDYYELSARGALPPNLVSEPPNYPACVASLEAAVARVGSNVKRPTSARLLIKCRQLHEALKTQATEFLVRTLWTIATFADFGIKATDKEIKEGFARWRAKNGLTSDAALNQYLTSRRRSVADELLVLKIDRLLQKAQQRFQAEGKQAVAKFVAVEQRWTTKTDCRPGYVVQHCKQYSGSSSTSSYPRTPPPSVLIEQVAAIATGRCINRPACTNQ